MFAVQLINLTALYLPLYLPSLSQPSSQYLVKLTQSQQSSCDAPCHPTGTFSSWRPGSRTTRRSTFGCGTIADRSDGRGCVTCCGACQTTTFLWSSLSCYDPLQTSLFLEVLSVVHAKTGGTGYDTAHCTHTTDPPSTSTSTSTAQHSTSLAERQAGGDAAIPDCRDS